jgi:hypothetical protein
MNEASDTQTVPWTARDVWLGLVMLGGLLLVAVLLSLALRRLSLGLNWGLIVSLAELLLFAPAWWLAVRKYGVGWEALGLRGFKGQAIRVGCVLMVLSYGFNLLYATFLSLFGLRMQVDLVPVFSQLSSPWLLLLGGAVVAPIVEEIFFRGFVFAGLRGRYGWQNAALISAFLFAVIHFTPTAFIPIFILGCIFAYLYQRSNSIWPAILMHASTNGLALGAAYVLARTNLGSMI